VVDAVALKIGDYAEWGEDAVTRLMLEIGSAVEAGRARRLSGRTQ
jgi:hypothetical protein